VRVLLDESIPVDFAQDLRELSAQTVIGLGWAGLKNGALLRQAEGQFQVLVTMDKNLQFQSEPRRARHRRCPDPRAQQPH
jgi:hypothetical protein